MKKTLILIPFALMAFSLISCSQLQSTLSSKMQEDVEEETGVAKLLSKSWYYNGTSGDDMSSCATVLDKNYFDQSLLIDFGKKACAVSVSGYIKLNYTDASSNSCSKTFYDLSGSFTDDYKGYRLDMKDVVKYFDTVEIPSGSASIDLKVSGFKCAEGPQNGRAIGALEVKGVQIKPLYETVSIDFSTVGYTDETVVKFDTNSEISLEDTSYTVTGEGSDGKTYSFNVSASSSSVVLKPLFSDLSSLDGVSVAVPLRGIMTPTAGHSYSKVITITFSKYAVIIDGKEDDNYSSAKGASVEQDSESDIDAFSSLGWSVDGNCDFSKVSVTNDDEYLYIGVSGELTATWSDAIVVMISNGKVTGASGASVSGFSCAQTQSFAYKNLSRSLLQPNVVLVHQPGYDDTGSGKLRVSAYVNKTNTDITSSVKCADMGWTSAQSRSFVEYAVPLGSVSGLNSSDTVNVAVISSLQWNPDSAVSDACPDSCVEYNNKDHTSVTVNLNNGISYTIR